MSVPFLVTHDENDRQIPLHYAHESHAEAVNSPDRELKIFTADEGGVEHSGVDNIEQRAASSPTGAGRGCDRIAAAVHSITR